MQWWAWTGLVLFFLLVLRTVWISLRVGISPMPTSPKVLKKWKNSLPAEIEGEVWELGCGWGTLLKVLCAKYPSHTIRGFECSPLPFWVSSARARRWSHTACVVSDRDFWKETPHEAGLVVCYLYTGAMKRIAEDWGSRLPEGCYVLSHTFSIPGWEPLSTLYAEDLYHSPIYLYRVKSQDTAQTNQPPSTDGP